MFLKNVYKAVLSRSGLYIGSLQWKERGIKA
jgi:hypothetical protein